MTWKCTEKGGREVDELITSKIESIINAVKIRELAGGLTINEIHEYYVNGGCILLTNLIKSQFLDNPNVRCVEFLRTNGDHYIGYENRNLTTNFGVIWQHMCAVVGDVDARGKISEDAIVFDINGKRNISEMQEYLEKIYNVNNNEEVRDRIYYCPYDEETMLRRPQIADVYMQLEDESIKE